MQVVTGYFDYCVSETCFKSPNFKITAKYLLELGYKTIAVNQTLEEGNLKTKKKKKKGESKDVTDIVPEPLAVNILKEDCEELKILNRLTISFSNQDIIHKIVRSTNYKKYHIIAVSPLTQNAFQFTCSNIDADIFSYNPESKATYKLSRKQYNQLVEKGFHYEILYGPAIQDSTQRKNMIHMSHLYHSYGKSKNVIMSSGAQSQIQFRSPYDVINLGFIFGLGQDKARDSILNNGRSVFLNSVSRRIGKVTMIVEKIDLQDVKEEPAQTIIKSEDEDEEEDMEGPALKKPKQEL